MARICKVEIGGVGGATSGVAGNLSRNGIYVWTNSPPPVGEVVELAIQISSKRVANVLARVAHVLGTEAAAALGRRPGAGFQFLQRCQLINDLIEEAEGHKPPRPCRVLVAEPNPRMLDRLVTAISSHGFTTSIAIDGAAAYEACQGDLPDVLLVSEEIPLLDGWALAAQLHDAIAAGQVAMVIVSDRTPNRSRMHDLGLDPTRHWLQKPFTDDELCARLRDLISGPPPGLRVSIDDLAVGTMLAFFERDRKSGIVTLTRRGESVCLHISQGRIARVEPAGDKAIVMAVLDWEEGEIEFRACEVPADDALGCSISRLLFDHARLVEERDTAVRSVDSILNKVN